MSSSLQRPDGSALAQVLVEFTRWLHAPAPMGEVLDHLVQSIGRVLPVTGAGVMLPEAPGRELRLVAASDPVLLQVEHLQAELGEGPCLQATQTGEAVEIADLRSDRRFPRFSARASRDGLAAVFAFPLRGGGRPLGALDLYRDTPGPLREQDRRAAWVLADVAGSYLANLQAREQLAAAVDELSHRSTRDPLTGLANRALLHELLSRALARRPRRPVVVLFIDLDRFKSVNDQHGHHVGDLLLVAVSERLRTVLRPADTLARLGGDEFVVLIEDLHTATDAQAVAVRMAELFSQPFVLSGRTMSVSASIGIARSEAGQDVGEVLLRDADHAMYEAKRSGGGQHRTLDLTARRAVQDQVVLERDLRLAQDSDELFLLYQPVIDVRTGHLAAAEALLRWQHPTRGLVLPEAIITSAERSGVIRSLGAWVLHRACSDATAWRGEGGTEPATAVSVAVNVSASQLAEPEFCRLVAAALADNGLPAERLSLELTETVLVGHEDRSLETMKGLRDMGVRLSMDDFGTGYSSLNYLRRFPFTNVKIDRSFVADLQDHATFQVVRAMIDLGHALGLTVTAEGIETAEQMHRVIDLGIDHAQGYYLGRPGPVRSAAGSGLSR